MPYETHLKGYLTKLFKPCVLARDKVHVCVYNTEHIFCYVELVLQLSVLQIIWNLRDKLLVVNETKQNKK